MDLDVMFSSNKKSHELSTPRDFFNALDKEFKFDIDVCAKKENAKCKKFFTPEIDGLKQEWNGTCFMNPPYGNQIKFWIKKAYEESLKGNTVVCLIPSRTDTKYWHEYCMKANEIRFIKGRLKFGDMKNVAPFPSAVVVFGEKKSTKILSY